MGTYNDLKAPRSKLKGRLSAFSTEFFDFLKEKDPNFPFEKWADFRPTGDALLLAMAEIIASSREAIELPSMIGMLVVVSVDKPIVKKLVNYKVSIENQRTIFTSNLHTDGRMASIKFSNYYIEYKLKNRDLWRFIPCRVLSRTVSKKFSENPDLYAKIDREGTSVFDLFDPRFANHKKR